LVVSTNIRLRLRLSRVFCAVFKYNIMKRMIKYPGPSVQFTLTRGGFSN
jgi:hypothetical protein